MVGPRAFAAAAVAVIGAGYLLTLAIDNDFYFMAGYVVLQFVVLATAWNILGGYTGYVNFGSAAFFAAGAYTTIALLKIGELPIYLLIPAAGLVSGTIGLATGYLTLRLRGVYFAIAKPGEVAAGDPFVRIAEDPRRVPVADIVRIYRGELDDPDLLRRAIEVPSFPEEFRQIYREKIGCA